MAVCGRVLKTQQTSTHLPQLRRESCALLRPSTPQDPADWTDLRAATEVGFGPEEPVPEELAAGSRSVQLAATLASLSATGICFGVREPPLWAIPLRQQGTHLRIMLRPFAGRQTQTG